MVSEYLRMLLARDKRGKGNIQREQWNDFYDDYIDI